MSPRAVWSFSSAHTKSDPFGRMDAVAEKWSVSRGCIAITVVKTGGVAAVLPALSAAPGCDPPAPQSKPAVPPRPVLLRHMGKLITYDSVRVAIAATVGKIIPKIKAKHWENIAQAMLDACIVEQGTDDMEWEGAARMYLHAYLSETGFIPSIESQRLQDQRRMMPSGTTHQAVSTPSSRRSGSCKAGVCGRQGGPSCHWAACGGTRPVSGKRCRGPDLADTCPASLWANVGRLHAGHPAVARSRRHFNDMASPRSSVSRQDGDQLESVRPAVRG